MSILLLLRRLGLLFLVVLLAGCRSERLAVALPIGPPLPLRSETGPLPALPFSPPPAAVAPKPAAAALAPAPPLLPAPMVPIRTRQAARPKSFQVLRQRLPSAGSPTATRRHGPGPGYFNKLSAIAGLILTVLLGLTIWAAFSAGLAGAILLGLLAVVLAALDLVVLIALFEG